MLRKVFYALLILSLGLPILDTGRSLAAQVNETTPPFPVVEEPFITIQVASFTEKLRATLFRNELIMKGYTAYIHESSSDAGITVYSIRFGKYKRKVEAEEYGRLFQIRERIPAIIVSTRSSEIPSAMMAVEEPPQAKTASDKEKQLPGREEWPRSSSKTFVYRKSDGTTYFTNRLLEVPKEYMERLEKVSIFPVQFLYFHLEKKLLYFKIDGIEQPVKLAGTNISPSRIVNSIDAYFKRNLKDKPLRLEYEPKNVDTRNNILFGHLYSKGGKSINLEMVRQGIAPFYPENISPSQLNEFTDAENRAKKEKLGIWVDLR
jgi:hypothetical protein